MPLMRFSVLGPLGLETDAGERVEVAGERQRTLLAVLLAHANEVVTVDVLADRVWGDEQPANPSAALQSQVSRLRKTLAAGEPAATWDLVTRPPGYSLEIDRDLLDATRFEDLLARAGEASDPASRLARLDEALGLWRGPAYAEFADLDSTRLEAIRLDELRSGAIEDRAESLLDAGRARDVVPTLESFVAEHPLRERARATLMRALYETGRQPDALRQYSAYRHVLGEELGLEPSGALQRLEADILDHRLEVTPTAAHDGGGPRPDGEAARSAPSTHSFSGLDRLDVRYLKLPDGKRIAHARVGRGPTIVVVPAWVTSLDIIAAGRDPRSSLLDRLAHDHELVLYDRWGTGMSRGEVDDFSLEYNAQELEWMLEHLDGPATLLAVSQSGPPALTVAHRRPELVDSLILFGTYASGPQVFPDEKLTSSVVSMIRAHWGMAAGMLANLYRPGASDEATQMLGRVLRDSASTEVAAGFLEEIYRVDVSDLLPEVHQPALVLHYRSDRLIHYRGGQQLASELPNARFVPLDGRYHLPDAADLDRIVDAIHDLVTA
jgi:DNA-binding SARP family transcriptional activator/pimeloyl-ACP methyl ester carboxylesterase